MGEDSTGEILTCQPTQGEPTPAGIYTVLYDGQCEVCQACVSWLKTLDRSHQTVSLPISAETLSALDSRLNLDDCLRQLHVLGPQSELYVGWDAVASLARLFPSTWLIGRWAVASRYVILGTRYTDLLPATDIPSASVVAERAV